MSTREFSHVYTDGRLAGTGIWLFESEWSTVGQRAGWRTLEWRGRHIADSEWRHRVVETGYRDSFRNNGGRLETVVRHHIIGSFALFEASEGERCPFPHSLAADHQQSLHASTMMGARPTEAGVRSAATSSSASWRLVTQLMKRVHGRLDDLAASASFGGLLGSDTRGRLIAALQPRAAARAGRCTGD